MHVLFITLTCCILPLLVIESTLGDESSAIDNHPMLNYCIDSKNHKSEPGPEDDLHRQCTPWKSRSCCTNNTAVLAHGEKMYGFNFNHCPEKPMSDQCRKHFVQDLCFYECSPNVGPWRQAVDGMKMRKERFFEVPLCASDCQDWFDDCRNDYTCTDNWSRHFTWRNETNHCPPQAQCQTFSQIYVNASNFCETVWDGSWKYTPDDQHCMRIWFDGEQGNPNDAVARWKIQSMINSARQISAPIEQLFLAFLLLRLLK